jgi:hypothetical protein
MLSVAALQKLERPRERNQIAALAVRETLLRMNVAKASPSVNIVTVDVRQVCDSHETRSGHPKGEQVQ